MKRTKKRTKKQTKKRIPKGLRLSQNKRYYGLFTIVVTFLLIISSTFAWVSWYEWKTNHLQGDPKVKTPQVKVEGVLGAQMLTHQGKITRDIKITNTGQVPVFIRVSLAETLVTFEVDTTDQTGNGHLKEYGAIPAGGTELQSDVLSTWAVGNYLKPANKTNYWKSVARDDYSYKKGEGSRPTALLPIAWYFGAVDPSPLPASGYWMYQEVNGVGYYYYSDIVEVGDQTTELVTDTELTAGAPNTLKGGLHQLEVSATGGEAMSGIYAEWGIPETSGHIIYDRYNELLTP